MNRRKRGTITGYCYVFLEYYGRGYLAKWVCLHETCHEVKSESLHTVDVFEKVGDTQRVNKNMENPPYIEAAMNKGKVLEMALLLTHIY